jgi:hypothetical protein
MQSFSANRAIRSLQRSNRKQAGIADRKAGNFYQRRTTDTAIGREEGEK